MISTKGKKVSLFEASKYGFVAKVILYVPTGRACGSIMFVQRPSASVIPCAKEEKEAPVLSILERVTWTLAAGLPVWVSST